MKRPEKKEEVEFIEDNMNKDDCYNNGFDIGLADGYNASCDDHDKFLPKEDEILRITIENTLKLNIAKKENQALVFTCCGKPIQDIRTSGLCPHCLAENTGVVELWKYNLAKALSKRLGVK